MPGLRTTRDPPQAFRSEATVAAATLRGWSAAVPRAGTGVGAHLAPGGTFWRTEPRLCSLGGQGTAVPPSRGKGE